MDHASLTNVKYQSETRNSKDGNFFGNVQGNSNNSANVDNHTNVNM